MTDLNHQVSLRKDYRGGMKFLVTFILGGGIAVLTLIISNYGLHNLFVKKRGDKVGLIKWEDKGKTPLGEKKYTPQGLTWVEDRLIFANSWKNKRSRVYEFDPSEMKILRHFDMPEGAVHTSGLAWDGERLWAVDYISNRAYCIDLETSLQNGRVEMIGDFDTTLRGTSACCIVPWDGERYLAISDFRRTRKTIFVKMEEALNSGTAQDAIEHYYINDGFSQGLEFIDGCLYESENKAGIDIINKMNLKILLETKDARKATIVQFPAPSNGVEDLAWSGDALWTSDETVFKFFRGTFE